MLATGMRHCIQIGLFKRQGTTVETLAVISQVPGAIQRIPKYHKMSVMCVTVSSQVQVTPLSGYVCFEMRQQKMVIDGVLWWKGWIEWTY
jgi:hypothetical protein